MAKHYKGRIRRVKCYKCERIIDLHVDPHIGIQFESTKPVVSCVFCVKYSNYLTRQVDMVKIGREINEGKYNECYAQTN